ncbi:hypothetical protein B0H17DRAFT_1204410 [Mycena rosella]|uniref:Uncharacterized protein n=1 Tax=Mycena rosella TaxID=1033263 RepID=A0AAD7D9L2_MYCRO|nr:hypothetical protein B0H17DRAFT_1204410 [Mycena rosella]
MHMDYGMENNPLGDNYASLADFATRSSTPGQDLYHSAPSLYMTQSSTSTSQSSDGWSSPSEPFTPHPFCFNQKAPPVQRPQFSDPTDCRQCIALKRTNLILDTENSTLKKAYEALLKVVGPAMFLAHAAGPSTSGGTVPPTIVSALSKPPPEQSDYMSVPYWNEHDFTKRVDPAKGESTTDDPKPRGASRAAQGINVAMQYVTDANGTVIDGFRGTAIRGLASKLFLRLAENGVAPTTWMKGSIDLHRNFSAEMCTHFPEMGLCAHDWKVQYLAKKMYPGWYKAHNAPHGIKIELEDDTSDGITQFNPNTKRSHNDCENATNKRTRLSSTPPPAEHNEHNDHDAGFFAVLPVVPPPESLGDSADNASVLITATHAAVIMPPTEEIPVAPAPAPFKIVNPLLSAPEPAEKTSTTPSDLAGAEPSRPADPVAVLIAPAAPTATETPIVVAATAPPSLPRKGSKEKKAVPGTTTTARNLCMISWCKTHSGGSASQFKLHWAAIEKNADRVQEWKQASANAAAAKTKAAS